MAGEAAEGQALEGNKAGALNAGIGMIMGSSIGGVSQEVSRRGRVFFRGLTNKVEFFLMRFENQICCQHVIILIDRFINVV